MPATRKSASPKIADVLGRPVPDVARGVTRAYVGAYAKRTNAHDDQQIFPSAEMNALAALMHLTIGLATANHAGRHRSLANIEQIAGAAASAGDAADASTDILGYVWAATWGVLPLDDPPIAAVEAAFDAGAVRPARGVAGAAWRAVFLAQAGPLFSHQRRRKAEVELARRVGYVTEKANAMMSQPASDAGTNPERLLALHDAGRLTFQVATLATVTRDRRLQSLGDRLAKHVGRGLLVDGSYTEAGRAGAPPPTAHLAQVLVGLAAAGSIELRDRLVHYLLRERLDEERHLLRSDAGPAVKYELSPWVPLALVSVASDPYAPQPVVS